MIDTKKSLESTLKSKLDSIKSRIKILNNISSDIVKMHDNRSLFVKLSKSYTDINEKNEFLDNILTYKRWARKLYNDLTEFILGLNTLYTQALSSYTYDKEDFNLVKNLVADTIASLETMIVGYKKIEQIIITFNKKDLVDMENFYNFEKTLEQFDKKIDILKYEIKEKNEKLQYYSGFEDSFNEYIKDIEDNLVRQEIIYSELSDKKIKKSFFHKILGYSNEQEISYLQKKYLRYARKIDKDFYNILVLLGRSINIIKEQKNSRVGLMDSALFNFFSKNITKTLIELKRYISNDEKIDDVLITGKIADDIRLMRYKIIAYHKELLKKDDKFKELAA